MDKLTSKPTTWTLTIRKLKRWSLRATAFKLFGVTINNSLRWSDHIESKTSEANQHLWLLKKLKRVGVSQKDLVYCYEAVDRPVLEYESPVWHTNYKSHSRPDLKQFSDELVRLLLLVARRPIQKTALLGLIDLTGNTENYSNKLRTEVATLFTTYLLRTSELSVTLFIILYLYMFYVYLFVSYCIANPAFWLLEPNKRLMMMMNFKVGLRQNNFKTLRLV